MKSQKKGRRFRIDIKNELKRLPGDKFLDYVANPHWQQNAANLYACGRAEIDKKFVCIFSGENFLTTVQEQVVKVRVWTAGESYVLETKRPTYITDKLPAPDLISNFKEFGTASCSLFQALLNRTVSKVVNFSFLPEFKFYQRSIWNYAKLSRYWPSHRYQTGRQGFMKIVLPVSPMLVIAPLLSISFKITSNQRKSWALILILS